MRQTTIDFSENARDLGMSRVEDSHQEWVVRAKEALRLYLSDHSTFFVDDFWASGAIEFPCNGKALGPVVQYARRQGWMVKSGRYRSSMRSNMTEKPVWESLIFREVSRNGVDKNADGSGARPGCNPVE